MIAAAQHRHQRGGRAQKLKRRVEQVVEQGHVDRRQHGEQQNLGHRQHVEAQVQADVGDAELQRADQHHPADETRFDAAPAVSGRNTRPARRTRVSTAK